MAHYDVVIIGSGAAGETVAAACAKAGKRTAVIDRRPLGGTCALRGCIPKKVLLAGAEAVARSMMLTGRGIVKPAAIDWPALMAFKRTYTDPVPKKNERWMSEAGIDVIHGTARFVSDAEIVVVGDKAHGDERISADAFVIATGARPMELGIEGEEHLTTSERFLDLDWLPQRIVFVGGGYISFEFAGIAHHAGAAVTVLHRGERVLEGFDGTLADMLAERYRRLGIAVKTGAPVERIERSGKALVVVMPDGRVEADLVVHGAGRVPDLDDLDLATGRVERTRRGVRVDAHMRSTSNSSVYAIGDAADSGLPLTPVAGAQGEVAAANILGHGSEFDPAATVSVVFSDPPMARVGIDAASVQGDDRYDVRMFDMSHWLTQTRVGNDTAGAVLVIDKASDILVGTHLLGVDADEVINIFALAVKFGLTVAQLKTMSWSYPTLSYDINYLIGRY